MLITGTLLKKYKSKSDKTLILPFVIICMLCGSPVGAIIITSLYEKSEHKNLIEALLPLCTNLSPMFITGYIYEVIVHKELSIIKIYSAIIIPELIYLVIKMFIFRNINKTTDILYNAPNTKRTELKSTSNKDLVYTDEENIIQKSIQQITIIGVYIMIFSIILNIIVSKIHSMCILGLSSFLEVTTGTMLLAKLSINNKIKTALIIVLTSSTGICSIFQVKTVISRSELSFIKYTIVKLLCALSSGLILYLMIS